MKRSSALPAVSADPGEVLTQLADAPRRLAEATAGVSARRLRQHPAPGEWSATEVLAHLRACADVRGGAIPVILGADTPTLRAVDPRKWMRSTDYVSLEFADSLRDFTAQRADLVTLLESLPPEGWQRSATVVGAGRPWTRTVLFYAQWVARHERPHLKQIERAVRAVRG